MGERRGLSHIEFVISFVIFIAFIVFTFVFLNPLQSNRTLKSTLDYSWIELGDSTKSYLETYSVAINPIVTQNKIAIDINGIPSNFNASVEDSRGIIISSYMDSNGYVHFSRPQDNFVRIKYSKEFPNVPATLGTLLTPVDYTISSSNSEQLHFEKLLKDLNRSYFSDYNALKTDFNLPNRVDFGFGVRFGDGVEIRAIKEIPKDVEILSKRDRVYVVRESGVKEYADVSVVVW